MYVQFYNLECQTAVTLIIYGIKQQSPIKRLMNIAQLGTMENMQKVAHKDELEAINVLEVVTDEEALIAQSIDAEASNVEASNGDDMAAARPSGYNKTEYDDAVGAFFKEMARYPLLKPEEEVELAKRVRILEEVRQAQAAAEEKLGNSPIKQP